MRMFAYSLASGRKAKEGFKALPSPYNFSSPDSPRLTPSHFLESSFYIIVTAIRKSGILSISAILEDGKENFSPPASQPGPQPPERAHTPPPLPADAGAAEQTCPVHEAMASRVVHLPRFPSSHFLKLLGIPILGSSLLPAPSTSALGPQLAESSQEKGRQTHQEGACRTRCQGIAVGCEQLVAG